MTFDHFILALTVWREARGQGPAGWAAVLHTILNRAAVNFRGSTPAKVCLWPMQFSSMTARGDQQTVEYPTELHPQDWAAWQGINAMLDVDPGPDPTQGAIYYYAATIPPPSWVEPSKFTVQIGAHKFYRA